VQNNENSRTAKLMNRLFKESGEIPAQEMREHWLKVVNIGHFLTLKWILNK